jgi:hypothetical protein
VLRSKGLVSLAVAACAILPTALLSATFSACGGSNICLGCSPSPTASGASSVTLQGTVVFTSIGTVQDLPVYICVDEQATNNPSTCNNPPRTTTDQSGDFLRTNITPGNLQIFFLNEPLDDSALVAKLEDPQGLLDDVNAGYTVTVDNVEVDFNTNVATGDITLTKNPTPTPAPTSTPSPASS